MAFEVKRELYCTMYRQCDYLSICLSGVAVAVHGKGTPQYWHLVVQPCCKKYSVDKIRELGKNMIGCCVDQCIRILGDRLINGRQILIKIKN